MDFSRIKYAVSNRVATITLSRPEKHNALDDVMVGELGQAFTRAQRSGDVKVIVLAAEGESFCSGADLEYLQAISRYDFNQNLEDSTRMMKLFLQIYTCRKPVIALVDGPALAGGCGLATVCDFVIAGRETARFGYPEVHVGFIPAIVLIFLVRRIGEGRGRDLALSGRLLNAQEAVDIGLVNRAVPSMEVEKEGLALAQTLVQDNSGSSMGLVKELMARVHGMSTDEALDYAANLNALTRMTDDCKKGIEAFLKKERQSW